MINIPFIKCWSSFLLVNRADLSYTKKSSQTPSSDFSRLSLNEYSSLEGNQYAVMSWVGVCVCVSCLVMSDSLQPRRLSPTRPLRPWDSPGKNTGVGCPALLQGIFQTWGSNPASLMSPAGRFFTTSATWGAPKKK